MFVGLLVLMVGALALGFPVLYILVPAAFLQALLVFFRTKSQPVLTNTGIAAAGCLVCAIMVSLDQDGQFGFLGANTWEILIGVNSTCLLVYCSIVDYRFAPQSKG